MSDMTISNIEVNEKGELVYINEGTERIIVSISSGGWNTK